MIIYNPPELKESILTAFDVLSFVDGTIEDIEFDVIRDGTQDSDYDVILTADSVIGLSMGEDTCPITTVKYFLIVSENWESAKINDSQSYARNKYEVDFLLNITDYKTLMLLEGLARSSNPASGSVDQGIELWKTKITIKGKDYHISVYNGFCLYHLKVKESNNYDKYLPDYSEHDYFVRITGDDIDQKVADSLAVSFIFELQATHNVLLSFSEGRPDFEEVYYEDEELTDHPFGIFPLLYGRGIKELLIIYNKAKVTDDCDYRILSFTKVIEYISPTIAQAKLYDQVRLKLSLPAVFVPTADYVIELGEIFRKHQADIIRDSELIRVAITTVVELEELWNELPRFVKPAKQSRFADINEEMKATCMENIVAGVYDTRNEIAHAKANYVKKGKVCPLEEKRQFVKMLDGIAVRCIRWFDMQSEEKRVILE